MLGCGGIRLIPVVSNDISPNSGQTELGSREQVSAQGDVRVAKWCAALFGLLGFVSFVALPFLPVVHTDASIQWPQNSSVESVTAPAMSYTPSSLDVSVPCEAVGTLSDDTATVLSFISALGHEASQRSMFIRATPDSVEIMSRNRVIASADRERVAAGECSAITVNFSGEVVTADFVGLLDEPVSIEAPELRPAVTGIYTDLDAAAVNADEFSVFVDLDSRFSTTPSVLKYAAIVTGIVSLLISLWALHRIDRTDGRGHRRIFPSGWFRPRLPDGVVIAVLGIWHFFGGNTSDDGYLLTMARAANEAGYLANYYRWYAVPESPFGSPYYDVLSLFASVSTQSPWMRIPALFAGLACWWLISREVLPRLGARVARNPIAVWTAATVFLAFWMAYNNGLRPEPAIALGALLTWCSIERAIATRRLFPAAVAVIVATLSLGAGPTGLMAVAALLAGARHIIKIIVIRHRTAGTLALVAPFLASGTAILVAVFGDQTLAAVLEAVRVRGLVGPNLEWYREIQRYYWLMAESVDGSVARRLPFLLVVISLVTVIAALLRHRRIAGAASGPTWRLVAVIVGTMFMLMFTPTKWSHHLGVYAGVGAAMAALGAIAIANSVRHSARNRTIVAALSLFVVSLSVSGPNGWWYVSSFGIPWWDKKPSVNGFSATTAFLILAVILMVIAAWQHFRQDYTTPRTVRAESSLHKLLSAPLAVIAAVLVVFSLASFAKGFTKQYPAYSIGAGNMRSAFSGGCQFADDILVEADPNKGFLTPVDSSLSASQALQGTRSSGFTPNGILATIPPPPVSPDGVVGDNSSDYVGPSLDDERKNPQDDEEFTEGVNGSVLEMPFDLDADTVPVLGSYTTGLQQQADLETAWYNLPAYSEDNPILVVTGAGRVAFNNLTNIYIWGPELKFQFGVKNADGTVTDVGEPLLPKDVGPDQVWRNFRVDLQDAPPEANAVRMTIRDHDLSQEQWVGISPPRVSHLETLTEYVGSQDPVLLDWAVSLQFPCQRPVKHLNGVMEIPRYRIGADRVLAVVAASWQSYKGGGPSGLVEMAMFQEEIPTYMRHQYDRDWGVLQKLTAMPNSMPEDKDIEPESPREAVVDLAEVTRSGLWNPPEILVTDPDS